MARSPLKRALTTISVGVASDGVVDVVARVLREALATEPVILQDWERKKTTVTVYLERRPPAETIRTIASRLSGLAGSIRMGRLPHASWAESWKRHFPALEFGRALLVKPSWIRKNPRDGQACVILDPGLSFGTGQHATTSFCLEQMVKFRPVSGHRSMLDLGCGSGILAIAAYKLGFRPVEALDFDPEAIRMSRQNAKRNQARISLREEDLAKCPAGGGKRFDLVCANLTADLLVQQAERITGRVRPGGQLVLAGILATEFLNVMECYQRAGCVVQAGKTAGEWRSARLFVVSGKV